MTLHKKLSALTTKSCELNAVLNSAMIRAFSAFGPSKFRFFRSLNDLNLSNQVLAYGQRPTSSYGQETALLSTPRVMSIASSSRYSVAKQV